MKICYITDGGNIHTARWLNYFKQRGHEVHLIYWRTNASLDKDIHFHQFKKILPKFWFITRYLSFLYWIFYVRKVVKEIKPDIIEAQSILDNGLLAVLSNYHPFVATAWGSDVLIFPKKNIIWKLVAKLVIKKADKIICDSETVKQGLLKLGTNPEKISIIYNGVDTKLFNPNKRSVALKKQLGTYGKPTIICIRNLRLIYNVEMVIKAIPLVLKEAPQAQFIIGGDGEQLEHLEALSVKLGVSRNVRFVGFIQHDKLSSYLASSEIYISTSISDSTSLSLQEAMACGLTPIVSDLLANREWVADGFNGSIVPQNDEKELAKMIVYYIKHKNLIRVFGEANKNMIRNKAEYSTEMAKVDRLYRDIKGNK